MVTLACNVPRNEALAKLAPESAEAATMWAGYLVSWTAWNTVRAAAAIAAMVSFAMALRAAARLS